MKRIISFALATVLVLGAMPIERPWVAATALAADTTIAFSGKLTINSSNRSSYDGKIITGTYNPSAGDVGQMGAIVIDGGTTNLTIKDLNINIAGSLNNSSSVSGIYLTNGATLNLTLHGASSLCAAGNGAGICVPSGCTLNITADSTGSLKADGGCNSGDVASHGGAGIGAEGGNNTGLGNIVINGGTINAYGGSTGTAMHLGAAAVGGSFASGFQGCITINGGTVNATSYYNNAAIGGAYCGSVQSIRITGGKVTATASNSSCPGAAIGCGASGNTENKLSCGMIEITGGTVTANGNIGYGNTVSGSAGNEGGSVAIGDTAAVYCTKSINPSTGSYTECTFNITVYDASLTSTVNRAQIQLPEGRKATANLNVEKGGIGTATVKALYRDAQLNSSGTVKVSFNNKSYYSESISLSESTNSVALGGYLYAFSGSIFDKNIALNTTAGFKLDGVSNIYVNATFNPKTAGTSEKAGVASFSGHFITINELSGEQTFQVTDSNGRVFTKSITFPAAVSRKSELSFSISDGSVPGEVKYIGGNKTEQTCTSFTIVNSDSTTWGSTGSTSWLVVYSDVTVSGRITANGTVNLILCDGAALSSEQGITVLEGNILNIYGQQGGTGRLTAKGNNGNNYSGIGGTQEKAGTICIYGGHVKATGGAKAAGIGGGPSKNGGTVCIYDGTVEATGGKNGAGIGSGCNEGHVSVNGGTIEIYGGKVTANGGWESGAGIGGGRKCNGGTIKISGGVINATSNKGAGIGGGDIQNTTGGGAGNITITGGKISATGNGGGAGIGTGGRDPSLISQTNNVSLGWTNASDSIYANSYGGMVTLIKPFVHENTSTEATTDNIDGKKIVPAAKVTIDSATNGTIALSGGTASGSLFPIGSIVTLEVAPAAGYQVSNVKYNDGEEHEIEPVNDGYSFILPDGDVNVAAEFSQIPADVPMITEQPTDLNLTIGFTSGNTLFISATAAGGHTLSYQWYSNATALNTDGSAISGATSASYTIPTGTTTGSYYYYCVVKATRSDNSLAATTVSNVATVTISDKAMTVNALVVNITYDGADHGIMVNVTDPESGATIKYGNSADSCTLDTSPTITNVCDSPKTVYFKITADNYADYTGSAVITIKPRPVKVSGIKVNNKDYDGSTTAQFDYTDVNFDGIIGEDILTVTATGEFAYANAGTNKTVNISSITLGGTGSANYQLAANGQQKMTTANISAVNIPVESIIAPTAIPDLAYNGAGHALVSSGSVVGEIGTMWYAVTESSVAAAPEFDGDSQSADKKWSLSIPTATNAGTYYVWYKVKGDDNHNDTEVLGPLNVSIAKAEVEGKHVQNLAFDSDHAEIKVGDTYTNPLSGAETTVTYTSSDESVVTVESLGTITAISEGTATITAKAEETDEYCSAEASYTVTVEKADQPSDTPPSDDPPSDTPPSDTPPSDTPPSESTPENNDPPRVPLAEGEAYASPTDNIAAMASTGNIKDMKLDLSNVLKAGVDPSGLKMTVINGSKLTTVGRVKDKDSVKCTGGVKAKVSRKTGEVKISCKSSGSITLTMDDDVTYTLSLTVDKPKAQKAAKTMEKNTAPVKRTIQELFGTQITSGKLTITKDKNSRAEITEDKELLIKPGDKDTLAAQYEYLNKRYKITIKIK